MRKKSLLVEENGKYHVDRVLSQQITTTFDLTLIWMKYVLHETPKYWLYKPKVCSISVIVWLVCLLAGFDYRPISFAASHFAEPTLSPHRGRLKTFLWFLRKFFCLQFTDWTDQCNRSERNSYNKGKIVLQIGSGDFLRWKVFRILFFFICLPPLMI